MTSSQEHLSPTAGAEAAAPAGAAEAQSPPPGSAPASGAEPDAVCAAAHDLALAALEEVATPGTVGPHLGVACEGERLVTHYFDCLAPSYHGWRWAVTVARTARSRTATVCESVLLPGGDAVLAPAWVPWSDRLAPGDLGASDVLPYRADDPLLEQGFEQTGDEESDRVAIWELGLGRPRVLGPAGRDAAAARWYTGVRGPTADEAVHAAAACSSCGYFVPLTGLLRLAFGVCANAWSASDGQVVSVDHGCGAHSETDLDRLEPEPLPEPILDELGLEAVVVPRGTERSASGEEPPADDGAEREVAEREVPEQEVPAGGAAAEGGTPAQDPPGEAAAAAGTVAVDPATEGSAAQGPAADAPSEGAPTGDVATGDDPIEPSTPAPAGGEPSAPAPAGVEPGR